MVKRKLAAHDNLKITIEQTGDKFHVKEVSNFRTLDIDFTLGVTFEYSLADGTLLSVSKHGLEWLIFFPSATPSNDCEIGPVSSGVCKIDQARPLKFWQSVMHEKMQPVSSRSSLQNMTFTKLPTLALLQSFRYLFISWLPLVPLLQGAWNLEGDMLKGTFTRKDNGKQLTTTRIVQGDELIQVK